MHFQRADLPLKLDGSKAAESFFAGCLLDCDQSNEHLFVAHLDGDLNCVHLSQHDGDACSADFPLRQIVSDAAFHGSAGIILAHNHPSGDSRPSDADCRATKRLAAVAEALDCTVLDHLIFGGPACTSLRGMGLL